METNKLVLWKRFKEKGWKESYDEGHLEIRDGALVLVEASGGLDPYQAYSSDRVAEYQVAIEDLRKWIKETGKKIEKIDPPA